MDQRDVILERLSLELLALKMTEGAMRHVVASLEPENDPQFTASTQMGT